MLIPQMITVEDFGKKHGQILALHTFHRWGPLQCFYINHFNILWLFIYYSSTALKAGNLRLCVYSTTSCKAVYTVTLTLKSFMANPALVQTLHSGLVLRSVLCRVTCWWSLNTRSRIACTKSARLHPLWCSVTAGTGWGSPTWQHAKWVSGSAATVASCTSAPVHLCTDHSLAWEPQSAALHALFIWRVKFQNLMFSVLNLKTQGCFPKNKQKTHRTHTKTGRVTLQLEGCAEQMGF